MKTQITIRYPSCLGFSIKKNGWKIGGYSNHVKHCVRVGKILAFKIAVPIVI